MIPKETTVRDMKIYTTNNQSAAEHLEFSFGPASNPPKNLTTFRVAKRTVWYVTPPGKIVKNTMF